MASLDSQIQKKHGYEREGNESVRSRQHLVLQLLLVNTWNVFDNAGRLLSETAVNSGHWPDWSIKSWLAQQPDSYYGVLSVDHAQGHSTVKYSITVYYM